MKTLILIETSHGGMLFSLTYLAAFLVAAGMMIYEGFKKGYPVSTWLLILLTGVIFFIIGDKVFTYSPEQWTQVFTRFHFPAADKKTVLGGIVGLFTGILLAKTWLRFNRPVLDTLAVALPLGMSVSRIGCLIAGCCFGAPTTLPWGIQYDAVSCAYQVHLAQGLVHLHEETSLAVHPAQAYQVIGCLIIAFIVWKTRKQWKSGGSLFLFSVLSYGVLRFFVEFVRAPESNFFTGHFFWGLKIIQWLIMGAILPGLLILIFRESKAKPIKLEFQPICTSDLRQLSLTILLAIIVFSGQKWFDFLERSTILLFLFPVVTYLVVTIYRRHSVAGFRWIAPAVLLCSFGFMAQKSIQPVNDGEKITFTEAGLAGMIGKYAEELKVVTISCGPSYSYQTLAQQSVPFYQTGINATYNQWKGKYNKIAIGGRIFFGDESPESTLYNPGSTITIGISPYIACNWRWFGFQSGFSLGQMKTPIGKPQRKLTNEEVISKGHSTAVIIPSLSLRFGPADIVYGEASFPGSFPFASPFPQLRAGIGTGFGKTNGTSASLGYCGDGIYTRIVYPIKNTWVLEAFYADNFSTGNKAQRVLALGVNFRFSFKKTASDSLEYKDGGKFRPFRVFSKLRDNVLDIDGNIYHSIALGGQVWMAENLKVTRYRDSSEISEVNKNAGGSGYNYNWNAVNDSRKLCPAGWHVPSLAEWTSLFNSLGGKYFAGRKLEDGFSAKGQKCQWWSSTEQDTLHAQSFYLDNETIGVMFAGAAKSSSFSVRCIRD